LSTLGVMWRFLLHRTGVRRHKQFCVRLEDIISRHHAAEVLRTIPPAPQHSAAGAAPRAQDVYDAAESSRGSSAANGDGSR
jgi:hypothetical protein